MEVEDVEVYVLSESRIQDTCIQISEYQISEGKLRIIDEMANK